MILRELRPALVALILFTLLTGIVYPAAMTLLARVLFPGHATGSLILKDGHPVGSALIGQPFDDPRFFWGRLSATGPFPFNAGASSGSNLGPLNKALVENATNRIKALRAADPTNTGPVPVDLVTASGSGLDPHISPAAAHFQVGRVARARNLSAQVVRDLVDRMTERPQLRFFGDPRVNVLQLNLALDQLR